MYVVVAWEAGSRHYNHANSNSRSARNSQEACACTRNLCQTRNGKFARWTCLLTRKCTVHTCIHARRTTREAVVTCGQTQHERESFMATPVYAHHPMPHLWGYQSNSQRKDASTRPLVVRNEKCHSWHITEREQTVAISDDRKAGRT